MGQGTNSSEARVEQTRARLIAVMKGLKLPSPERMLGRIEKMLPERDRERILSTILADFEQQGDEEKRRILRILAPDRDDWTREVEKLISSYRPAG
jgi:hypothetical protein